MRQEEVETDSMGVKLERCLFAITIDDDTRIYQRKRGADAENKSGDNGGNKQVEMQNI